MKAKHPFPFVSAMTLGICIACFFFLVIMNIDSCKQRKAKAGYEKFLKDSL